ncbi:MAG: hypothetical protein WD205_10790 [Rhodothermales bacterium]
MLVPPKITRAGEAACRQALQTSSRHLESCARVLAPSDPDYHGALKHSLESIRQAFAALLAWHGRAPRPDATLTELPPPKPIHSFLVKRTS